MKEIPRNGINSEDFLTDRLPLGLQWEKSSSNQIGTDGCLGERPFPFFYGTALMAHKQKGCRTGLTKQQHSSECF